MSELEAKELDVKWENGKICQVCFVVESLERAAEYYWKDFGFGPWYFWDFEPPDLRDFYYKGIRVENSAFRIALAQIGPIQYELIEPMYGIGIQKEFLEENGGDGFHHIKIYYEDIPKAKEMFKKKGIYPLQEAKYDGDWHVYMDTVKEHDIIWEIGNQGEIRPPYKKYPE